MGDGGGGDPTEPFIQKNSSGTIQQTTKNSNSYYNIGSSPYFCKFSLIDGSISEVIAQLMRK